MWVVDTSVIYKWYVEEEHSDKALSILNTFIDGTTRITIPDLVFYELSNAMRFNPENTEKDVRDVIKNLADLNLDIVVITEGLINNAIKMAYKYNLTVYDSVFVALAKDLEFEFVTADEKLFRRIRDMKFVNFLGEI